MNANTTNATVTIIVDNNTADVGLSTEHGLSFWIETPEKRILLDTGQGDSLEPNARALGIDLVETDILVLSHGHYDHTGAIAAVVQAAPNLEGYCHPGVTQSRYAVRDGEARSIGMPRAGREALASLPQGRLHQITEPTMLTQTVGLTGFVPRTNDFEDTGGPFFLDPEGKNPDPIEDDLALFIKTEEGIAVCFGCAHAGVVNTLDHIVSITGDRRFRAAIGGFHLGEASPERMEQTIQAMRRHAPRILAPCHCTGQAATAALKEALADQVTPAMSGMVFEF